MTGRVAPSHSAARLLAAAAALALCITPASAAPNPRAIVVTGAWSRPTPKGLPTGVVYLSITNHGAAPDRLIRASTPVADQITLHRSSMRGGVMSMDAVPEGLAIPAGGTVRIAPGGYHLMLTGLKTGLGAGRRFPVKLTFARAGAVRTEVEVRSGQPAMGAMPMR